MKNFCYDYKSFIIFDAAGSDKKPKWSLSWIMKTKRTNFTVSTCQIFDTIFRFTEQVFNDFRKSEGFNENLRFHGFFLGDGSTLNITWNRYYQMWTYRRQTTTEWFPLPLCQLWMLKIFYYFDPSDEKNLTWQLFWKFNKVCGFDWQNFRWAHWASNLAI